MTNIDWAQCKAAPTAAELLQVERDRLHRLVNEQYAKRMSAVALPYPQYERESWPIQLQRAGPAHLVQGCRLPLYFRAAHRCAPGA